MRQLLVLVALAVAAGCGSPPCTHCPNVAGTYRLAVPPMSVDESSCKGYLTNGFTFDLPIGQLGSKLVVADLGGTSLHGTLHENLYVGFSSFPGVTSSGDPTTNTISGRFSGTEGAWHFKGDLGVEIQTVSPTGCGLTAPLEGDELPK